MARVEHNVELHSSFCSESLSSTVAALAGRWIGGDSIGATDLRSNTAKYSADLNSDPKSCTHVAIDLRVHQAHGASQLGRRRRRGRRHCR